MIVSDIYDENIKYMIDKRALIGGENLVDAKGSFDQTEGHAVSFRFDTDGAQKFGKITSNNVGNRLAVVLDGVVITAPRINSAITGGSGIITGNFNAQEASDLAVLLRAGALPAPLEIVEESSQPLIRQVGIYPPFEKLSEIRFEGTTSLWTSTRSSIFNAVYISGGSTVAQTVIKVRKQEKSLHE